MKRSRRETASRKWHDLLRTWTADNTLVERSFEEVREHYAEPSRFYHTLDHIQTMLATVESLDSHATNLNAVKLAAWLHDVIYDSKATDNEERSADYAVQLCRHLSIPLGSQVAELIRKTKTHIAGDDIDAQLLLDADLAILGASEADYRDYAEKIRREYSWVPESEYRVGRRKVLESFLKRVRIFHFLDGLEQPARRNIADEIRRLDSIPR